MPTQNLTDRVDYSLVTNPGATPASISFTLVSGKLIRYDLPSSGDAMPVTSEVKVNEEPHPHYFEALNELTPFVVDVMNLGPNWMNDSQIGSLRLSWTYNDEDDSKTYKIVEIVLSRSSASAEILINRSIACRGIVADDIPEEVQETIDRICDEAYAYCTGQKTSQGSLFEMPPSVVQTGTRSKARTLAIAS